MIAVLAAAVTMGVTVLLYVMTKDFRISAIGLGGGLEFCLLLYLMRRLDDAYISGIVVKLSDLMDVLTELEDKEVFPENEETLLSKLQSKVIKLSKILKNKSKKEAREQENMKKLVSDISHQLKTPLANLKMYSQFLEDDALPEEKRKEYVAVVRLSVERLDFLAEHMIKVSRLESGLIQPDMHRQSLNETVLKAVKNVYPKAKKKGIEIQYREENKIVLSHDQNWTAEAIGNLLDNAIKYGETGGRILLSLRKLGMFAELSVEDENGAIPKEEQNRVFTRFYRGSNSRNREGIGVGLYLAGEIAQKQGGYMNLKTTDKGNIFSLVLYADKTEMPYADKAEND